MKDDIFNPNSYTEKAMPLTSALCDILNNLDNLGKNSEKVEALMNNGEEKYKDFCNTLNKEQNELFFEVENNDILKSATENTEFFCRGFKFGILLMKEIFG